MGRPADRGAQHRPILVTSPGVWSSWVDPPTATPGAAPHSLPAHVLPRRLSPLLLLPRSFFLCVSLHAPAQQMEQTVSNGTRLGLAFATAVTRGNASRWDLNVSPRRVCRCQTRPTSRPGARSRCRAMCKHLCGSCIGHRGRLGRRGGRALALGAVGRTHLMVLEHWQPKPRADRRLSHLLRICSCRGLAQHGEHGRVAAASTRSSTSTSSGAGASMRSADRSRWRPRARRRPQHSP